MLPEFAINKNLNLIYEIENSHYPIYIQLRLYAFAYCINEKTLSHG
jgi:hypothetical protein